jgi:hypothetical protein
MFRFVGFINEKEDELFILLVEVTENNNFYFTKINNVKRRALKILRRK